MLGLRLGGLEWACEDAHLGVFVDFLHLGVRELLVNNDTVNERRIFDATTSLGHNFDQFKVDITTLKIGNVEDSSDGQICEVILALGNNLRAEGGLGALSKLSIIVLEDIELFLDFGESVDGNIASNFETICDFQRVNASLQKFLGLLEDGTSEHNNTGGSITDFVILRCGELSQKSGSLMMNLSYIKECVSLSVSSVFEFVYLPPFSRE